MGEQFMRFIIYPFVFLVALMSGYPPAWADEFPAKRTGGQSGLTLSYYCTHVPDLSVNRPDSVDTWVKICTVYFNARTNLPDLRPGRPGRQGGPGAGKQLQPPANKPEPPPRE